MIIKNVQVFRNGNFRPGMVRFGKTITEIRDVREREREAGNAPQGIPADSNPEEDCLDGDGGYLIPGLIDIHTHAAAGADASDGDEAGLAKMAQYYAKGGVTSFCPTTMTLPEDRLQRALGAIRKAAGTRGGAKIAGIHLEGPFVSPEKCGAQNPDYICPPDAEMFQRLQETAGGLIRLITVAPEVAGAIPFVETVSRSCTVSLGHTATDYDTAMRAFEAGASHVTHLFNAMPPLLHRAPGLIAAAADAGATAELIPDGLHVAPAMVRLAHRLFGEKLVLISDSLRCAGMPDGTYELGGQRITLCNRKATLEGTDTLAGSSIHLTEGLRRAYSFGIPLADAVFAVTEGPAAVIGSGTGTGRIETGYCADLVLLDTSLQVKAVFIDGEPVSL